MNISIVAPDPFDERLACGKVLAQARYFQRRGDRVCVYVEQTSQDSGEITLVVTASLLENPPAHWLDSDVYIYHDSAPPALLESIRQIRRGVVILLCHTLNCQALVHYADVCIVETPELQAELHAQLGYPPERVFVLPGSHSPGEDGHYTEQLGDIVTRAMQDDLPTAQLPELEDLHPAYQPSRLDALQLQADVRPRGYVVRSRVPLFGGLIAWVRRNLTSHLREPYLDPILDRQVAFNRHVANEARESAMIQDDINQRLARIENSLTRAGAQETKQGDRSVEHKVESVIEIRDPALDREAIVQRLQGQISQRQAAGACPNLATLGPQSLRPTPPDEPATTGVVTTFPGLDRAVNDLVTHSRLHEPQFVSRIPLLGALIVAVRRAWNWMSTRWYVLPVLWQQSEINVQTSLTISEVARWQSITAQCLAELQTRVREIEDRLDRLEQKAKQ